MHTREELRMRQALPLNLKIRLTEERIREWINHYGVDGVYVSFSGGKDRTVLLDIVRRNYPKVPAVFCDTGLEYPEIREFVKTFENVTWLKPKMNFKQVIERYGYPLLSKEISQTVSEERIWRQRHPNSEEQSCRTKKLDGTLVDKNTGKLSAYNLAKWKFLLDAPFAVSHRCCNVMKKTPAHNYEKETGRRMITAEMASESRLRTQKWIVNGCNGFEMKRPKSMPMAFWTEQDVLLYIKQNNLPICSVYGDIVEVIEDEDAVAGQMTISDIAGFEDWASFDAERPALKTTGCDRTGCMFCGFGCHLEDPGSGRFERMKKTHPKQYEWIMKPWTDGGLGYKEVIDWINEHGDLDIRY